MHHLCINATDWPILTTVLSFCACTKANVSHEKFQGQPPDLETEIAQKTSDVDWSRKQFVTIHHVMSFYVNIIVIVAPPYPVLRVFLTNKGPIAVRNVS